MRFGRIIALLLLLNAAALWYFARPRQVRSRLPESEAVVLPVQEVASQPETLVQQVAPLTATNAFHWGELEVSDYREYIRRLRAIGCPEQTIRDLIIADIDKLYSTKLRSLIPLKPEVNFWESEDSELANNHDQRSLQRQQREVEREKAAILRELLGVDLALERQRGKGQVDKLERRLGFLPEERRSELRQLIEKWEDQEHSIREQAWDTGAPLTPEDRARLRALRAEKDASLNQILTPEERERYDLWMSSTAESLRHDFYGLGASEEEFRSIYQLRKAVDEAWPLDEIDPSDEATLEAWGKALLQLEEGIKETLGEERFSMYQRGQDQRFHELNATASRFNLPREKAAEGYEYLRLAQQEKNRILESGNFPPDQQAEVLRRIDIETERALREVLGEGPYFYFSRRAR
jgi:hypothetical protein